MPPRPDYSPLERRLHSTILPDIVPGVTFFTLAAVIVTVACDKTGYQMKVNTVMLTILGTMLSFVISVRASTANERYNEGRRAWSSIQLAARNFGFNVMAYLPPTTLTASELAAGLSEEQMEVERAKAMIEKKTILNLVSAFAVATKHYLRGESGVYHEDLYPLIACLPKYPDFPSSVQPDFDEVLGLWRTPHKDGTMKVPASVRRRIDLSTSASTSAVSTTDGDLEKGDVAAETIELQPAFNPPPRTMYHHCPPLLMFKPLFRLFSSSRSHQTREQKRKAQSLPDSNVPLQISLFLSSYLNTIIVRGTMPVALISPVLAPLGMLQDSMTILERVLNTPLPFPYSAHLRLSVYIYLLFLPFQTYALLGYLTVVASFLASVVFLGFVELGTQLENPFGYDDSDLDLDLFCRLISKELTEIASHPLPDPSSFVFSLDNMPFPHDPRTAQQILADATKVAADNANARPTWQLRKAFARHHSEMGIAATEKLKRKKAAQRQSVEVLNVI